MKALVGRYELAPCWPVEHDISSNAMKGLPDLHSPARTPFLLLSGLFITVLTSKGLLSRSLARLPQSLLPARARDT